MPELIFSLGPNGHPWLIFVGPGNCHLSELWAISIALIYSFRPFALNSSWAWFWPWEGHTHSNGQPLSSAPLMSCHHVRIHALLNGRTYKMVWYNTCIFHVERQFTLHNVKMFFYGYCHILLDPSNLNRKFNWLIATSTWNKWITFPPPYLHVLYLDLTLLNYFLLFFFFFYHNKMVA